MGSDFDEGSFKKARSFLMVFSTMLLVLWYFKAEMTTLSLLGNSVKFTANTHNLWLVLAAANLYFFCRYIQHLPRDWRKPGKAFDAIFDSTLCRVTQLLYKRRLRAIAWDDFKSDHDIRGIRNFKVKPNGSRHYSRDSRTGEMFPRPEMKVEFSLPSTWISSNNSECSSTGAGTLVTPARPVILYARVSSFIKGLLLAPWFTEHLFPMLYAIFAITVGLLTWYTVHPTTSEIKHPYNERAYQVTALGKPQVFECLSAAMESKHSVLSVACASFIDVAESSHPLVLDQVNALR